MARHTRLSIAGKKREHVYLKKSEGYEQVDFRGIVSIKDFELVWSSNAKLFCEIFAKEMNQMVSYLFYLYFSNFTKRGFIFHHRYFFSPHEDYN